MPDVLMKTGAYGTTNSGEISYRTAGYAVAQLLKRGRSRLILDRFGQRHPMPKNKTTTIAFRRYNSLQPATTPLSEGVTPDAIGIDYEDVKATLKQYGAHMRLTNVIQDTHEDPVLRVMSELAGEQAADTLEQLHFNALMGGTNVFYAGGVNSRAEVSKTVSLNDFRKVARSFLKQKAAYITEIVGATPKIATEPIGYSFIAICSTDLEADIRNIPGFVPVEKYSSSIRAMQYELGKVENFRVLTSTFFDPWLEAGATVPGRLSGGSPAAVSDGGGGSPTTTDKADVYPILCLARDAYGVTPLSGYNNAHISVLNPGKATKDDPHGQRGFVAWDVWDALCILNEAWMARIECTCSDLSETA